jgi:hypothetical protein
MTSPEASEWHVIKSAVLSWQIRVIGIDLVARGLHCNPHSHLNVLTAAINCATTCHFLTLSLSHFLTPAVYSVFNAFRIAPSVSELLGREALEVTILPDASMSI